MSGGARTAFLSWLLVEHARRFGGARLLPMRRAGCVTMLATSIANA